MAHPGGISRTSQWAANVVIDQPLGSKQDGILRLSIGPFHRHHSRNFYMRILAPCPDFGGTIIEPLVNKNMRVGSRRFGSLVYVQWTSGIDNEPWPWDAWVRFLKNFPGATFLCCHSCLKLRYIFWFEQISNYFGFPSQIYSNFSRLHWP